MVVPLRVNLTQFHQLGEQVSSADALAETVATMTEVSAYLERQVVLGTPRNTGTLAGGMTSSVEVLSAGRVAAYVSVQGPGASYALPVEEGSRPHFPPLEPIELWVKRKALAWTDKRGRRLSIRSMAYLIARSIAQHGQAPVHMARNAVTQGAGQIDQIIERHFDEFVKRLGR